MVHTHWIAFLLTILLLIGCATTTVIKDSQKADIQLTRAGELIYRDKTVTLQQVAELLRADRVKRDEIICILIPTDKEARDYMVMRSLADTLKRAGYGRIVFNTEKKAMGILKEETK